MPNDPSRRGSAALVAPPSREQNSLLSLGNVPELEIGLLKTLVAVARHGGFTAAAGARRLTQSAVSLQVRRLEDLLGAQLFHRTPRGPLLTTAGERLLAHARRILRLHEDAVLEFAGRPDTERLRAAVPEDVPLARVRAAILRASAASPLVRLEVSILPSRASLPELGHAFDLVVATHLDAAPGAEILRVDPLEWVGALPRGGAPLSVALYSEGCLLRHRLIEALDRAGVAWSVALESSSPRLVVGFAAAGHGVTAARRRWVPRAQRAPLAASARLPRLGPVALALHRARGRSRALSAAAAAFSAALARSGA
ncbi:LysR family transcriptional regulator [Sorangium sp. So ce185]|uniref:LysR family transcriptional regulator n=1 Tax=Sorangium sp. So ce185 TaxID=3133287 RepID=UPI003F5D9AFF